MHGFPLDSHGFSKKRFVTNKGRAMIQSCSESWLLTKWRGRDGQTIEWNDHLFRKQRLHWQPNVEKNYPAKLFHDSNYFPSCLQVPTWAGGGQQYFHREFKQILAWNPSPGWEDLHDAAPLDIDIPAPHIRAIHDISRTISKGWHIRPEHYIFT